MRSDDALLLDMLIAACKVVRFDQLNLLVPQEEEDSVAENGDNC